MSKRKIKDGQEERGGTAFRRAMIAAGAIAAAAALVYLAGAFCWSLLLENLDRWYGLQLPFQGAGERRTA